MNRTEAIIIGAGPIGLELACVFKQLGLDYRQIDAGQVGQTVTWYPRQVRFFSSPDRIAIAGVPLTTVDQSKATREEYLAYLRSIVEQFDLHVQTYEKATRIERLDDGLRVHTERRGQTHQYDTRHVIVAIGDMHRPRQLGIEGEDLPHVSHYFEEPHKYFQQKLLIVGGKNSAVEAALRCHRAGAEVTISYRRADFDDHHVKYWLTPEIRSLIQHDQIAFHPETAPVRITPDHVTLAGVDSPGETTDVEADFVLLLTGYQMDATLFVEAGVELEGDNDSPTFDPKTMQTNVPGLYVAGTAAAGTQRQFKLFIENCHPHVERITRAITGEDAPPGTINPVARKIQLPES